eukprot:CAMPEP_0119051590 /NCGR_PEP_ID=MMETSP1177-20130426/73156_1 /TAXON_ID=2985 /ORGANISM="Ochromonas sp, Strain CCMP1899" /LENGTH=182 /DNA_ID=CAMNT_0007030845 /DNA_START=146 /DNA_END=694 /DNA_ORIENTATION=+
MALEATKPGAVVWSSSAKELDLGWYPLDDVIMGGQSKTSKVPSYQSGEWSGIVSTVNGGFAGIRSKQLDPLIDASSCSGFKIKLTGDGQRYKFVARDSLDWGGITFAISFDTIAGELIEVNIPFDRMIPTMRARTIQSPPLNKNRISAIQLTLSKFEYDGGISPNFKEGPFKLDLDKISFMQ